MSAQDCLKRSAGGKGSRSKFIDRNPQICAAGLPTRQAEFTLKDVLQQYLLDDEVNALISDAKIPPPPTRPLLPLSRPIQKDLRNSGYASSELDKLINPPKHTNFQVIANDLKETTYASYWKKPLGRGPDCTPMFPDGFDIEGTTYGKKPSAEPSLYDIICPINPPPGQVPPSKECAVQTCRNYCRSGFNPDVRFGHRCGADKRGVNVKCALTNDCVAAGREHVICSSIKADLHEAFQPGMGTSTSPNNNIGQVAEGHRFGKISKLTHVKECLTSKCDLNPGRDFFLECLAHLNTVRKNMSKKFIPSFYKSFYNNLKYMDKDKTGWLPLDVVLEFASTKHINLDSNLITPLLEAWHAFDGNKIEYKTLCQVLNTKERLPDLPIVRDLPPECLDFRTTYREMTKSGQDPGPYFMAGAPSGRYFDTDYPVIVNEQCSAHKTYLPMETDMNACISPSLMATINVTHRDMYAKREPHVVRRVFEAAGEKFTEERFNKIWEEAKKYHSQGLVCYETFRRALSKFHEVKIEDS